MPRKPYLFRLSEAESKRIDDLGRLWGSPEPLDRTATLREMIRRCWLSEERKRERATAQH
jgi:hypothetical protein